MRNRLSLKDLKIARHMSEETTAFTAKLCLDGKPIAYCKNDGHGGSTLVQALTSNDRPALAEVTAWAASLPPSRLDMGDGKTVDWPVTVDSLVDDLLAEEDARNTLQRKLRVSVLFARGGKIFSITKTFCKPEQLPAKRDAILAKNPGAVFLNEIPFAEALQLWRAE
jgi:hypothetical protein